MILAISNTALQPIDQDVVIRSGALRALWRLQAAGFTFTSPATESFAEELHQLLDQEGLKWDGQAQPDFVIRGDEKSLIMTEEISADDEQQSFDSWADLADALILPQRTAEIKRTTSETDISIQLNLDGSGQTDIQTGLNFFDHMLDQIGRHGDMDLTLHCDGDLEVDEHHTIEDVAIALGEAISKAMGEKRGIERYGFVLPMDETRAMVAIDFSGRPYLKFEGSFTREYVGDFPLEMAEHFFYSLAMHLKATLHIAVKGQNDHHKIEACFKGLAKAIRMAKQRNESNITRIPSSKGTL
jgi:imidazoleglycerol phosphate dehydratase HisB